MWEWLDKIGEFAVTNVRVVGDAIGAFIVWCVIALVSCWWLMGQIYDAWMTDAVSQITTLKTRLGTVTAERDDLVKRATGKSLQPSATSPIDPDGIFQFRTQVGSAELVQIDDAAGIVHIGSITGATKLNVDRGFTYRTYVLKIKSFGSEGRASFAGQTNRVLNQQCARLWDEPRHSCLRIGQKYSALQ